MNWTDRLQRRFGFLAIPGLGRIIVGLQMLCFVGGLMDPRVVESLKLDPALVMQGEVWRLVTFLFLPSLTPLNIIFAVFFFMFQWMVFNGLEAEWGDFKLTLYCAIGWLCALALPLVAWTAFGVSLPASGGYWSTSIELAFAFLYPEFTVTLYFILPVKMKWMAWFIGAFLVFQAATNGAAEALIICVGLLNYLLFFGPELVAMARHRKQVQEGQQVFSAAKREAELVLGPRACNQCGAGPDKGLRLCSCPQCGGDGKLWCEAHLPGHLAALSAAKAAEAPVGATPSVPEKRAPKAPSAKKKASGVSTSKAPRKKKMPVP